MASQSRLPLSRALRSLSALNVYVGLVITAGLLVLGLLMRDLNAALHSTDLAFWLVAACALPAEIVRYPISHHGEVHHTTMSRPFALAMLTGWAIPATVLVFVVASIISDLNRRRTDPIQLVRIPFNVAQYVLSLTAASKLYWTFGGQSALGLRQVPVFIATALVLVYINHLLVVVAVSLSAGEPITIRTLLTFGRIDTLEGAVQCGGVLIALLAGDHRPLLPLLLAVPAAPLLMAARESERIERLQRSQSQIHELGTEVEAMLRVTELERVRLAANLHDGPLRLVDQLGRQLQAVFASIEAGRPDFPLMQQLRQRVPALSSDLRSFVAELRPPVLDRLGLAGALDRLAKEFQAAYGELTIDVQVDGAGQLAEQMEVLLYRVTEEALANVVKHARASHVEIAVTVEDGRVWLRVHDDGTGFDPSTVGPGHFGLTMMRERVWAAGGTFQVVSTPDDGTTVRAELQTASLA